MANLQLTKPETGDTVAIMHTTMGDIKIKLFGDKTPKPLKTLQHTLKTDTMTDLFSTA